MRAKCTFFDVYDTCVRVRLEAIDIFLREAETPYAPADVAELLAIAPRDLSAWLQDAEVKKIDRAAFFQILQGGTSYICQLYRRVVERGAPVVHTRDDIAYIYGLAPEAVHRACDALGIREATALLLPKVFAHIPIVL